MPWITLTLHILLIMVLLAVYFVAVVFAKHKADVRRRAAGKGEPVVWDVPVWIGLIAVGYALAAFGSSALTELLLP